MILLLVALVFNLKYPFVFQIDAQNVYHRAIGVYFYAFESYAYLIYGSIRSLMKARDAAWADAETRAAQLAGLAGRELGEVLAIEEVVESHRPPRPMRMAMSAEMASDARMTLDAGEGAVVVTLDVSWSLR